VTAMTDRESVDHDRWDHDRWDQLAAGHALYALEPAETAEFEQHLAHCQRCRQSLDDMSFVAGRLGSLASGSDAPPWRRIRAGVVGADAAPAKAALIRRWLLPAATAAAALTAVAVLGVRLTGGSESPALTAAACARDASCHHVVLQTPDGRDIATVLVRDRTATIASVALGPPPSGTQWVLWQVPRAGRPVFVQSFRSAPGPTPTLPSSYADTASFALSDEPAGSRPAQPTRIVASGLAS
jgi:hypothetical protein